MRMPGDGASHRTPPQNDRRDLCAYVRTNVRDHRALEDKSWANRCEGPEPCFARAASANDAVQAMAATRAADERVSNLRSGEHRADSKMRTRNTRDQSMNT